MKAFLIAAVALVAITVAAPYVLTEIFGYSTADNFASDSVRLPGE